MQGKYKNKAYSLRIEEKTLDTIKSIAAEEGRTANKQIEHILENYIENRTNYNIEKENESMNIRYIITEPNEEIIIEHYKQMNPEAQKHLLKLINLITEMYEKEKSTP